MLTLINVSPLGYSFHMSLMQTTEVDLRTKGAALEDSARSHYERDQELLAQTPPKDWEGLAREGASSIQDSWQKAEGKSLVSPCTSYDFPDLTLSEIAVFCSTTAHRMS